MDFGKFISRVARWASALSASTNCELNVGRKIPAGRGVPSFSWLYFNAPKFRKKPHYYPNVCSWCAAEFMTVREGVRVCPRCDLTVSGEEEK